MNAFAFPSERPDPAPPSPTRGRGSSMWEWRIRDQIVLVAAWVAGLGLCLVTGAIVIHMGVRGFQYLRPDLLVSRPLVSTSEAGTGGFLDPLIGTFALTAIGIAIALPLGVCSAAWIDRVRSRRPGCGLWRGWWSRASRSSPAPRTW